MTTINRRIFFANSLAASLMTLMACTDAGQDPHILQSKNELARNQLVTALTRLFPIKGLNLSTYLKLTDQVIQASKSDETLADVISQATTAFEHKSSKSWLQLTMAEQNSWLTENETEGWFEVLLIRAGLIFSEMRELWDVIGYPGSSVEYGGYIDRGFNDIDWLPEVDL